MSPQVTEDALATLLARAPRAKLATLPTPLEAFPRLGAAVVLVHTGGLPALFRYGDHLLAAD